MRNYSEYEVSDFLSNDSFVEWATGKSAEHDVFWRTWPESFPSGREAYYQALEIASGLRVNPVRDLNPAEISDLVEKIAERIVNHSELAPKTPNISWYQQRWLRIAASVILVSSAAAITYLNFKSSDGGDRSTVRQAAAATEVVRTEPGVIRLPDNSTVILKAGGSIRYSSDFQTATRDVYLEGEAFFEVTKNPARPFIVHANGLLTKVLGTSFLVKAYKNSKEFKVVVNTGKVSVFPETKSSANKLKSPSLQEMPESGVLITPNQELTFYPANEKLVKKKLEKPAELSKEVTDVKFNFIDAPFSEVVAALSKAYGIKISYNEKQLAGCPLTASLSNQHLYQKLDLICQALEAKYQIVDGEIVIEGKGCTEPIIN